MGGYKFMMRYERHIKKAEEEKEKAAQGEPSELPAPAAEKEGESSGADDAAADIWVPPEYEGREKKAKKRAAKQVCLLVVMHLVGIFLLSCMWNTRMRVTVLTVWSLAVALFPALALLSFTKPDVYTRPGWQQGSSDEESSESESESEEVESEDDPDVEAIIKTVRVRVPRR